MIDLNRKTPEGFAVNPDQENIENSIEHSNLNAESLDVEGDKTQEDLAEQSLEINESNNPGEPVPAAEAVLSPDQILDSQPATEEESDEVKTKHLLADNNIDPGNAKTARQLLNDILG